ncbi:retinol retinaldehyde reductase [Nannochloropsis oceanica]
MGLLNLINNIAHIPVFEDVCYYNFFFWAWFLGPLLGGLVFLHDLTTGFFFSIFYVKPSLDKVIFITGCDTGFGKTLALRLQNKGFKVYATCLNQQNADALKKECEALHTVILDVTKEDQVARVVAEVDAANPQGLFALVNNAGVSRAGLIDWLNISDFRFCMEVNYFAMVSVTKAFLPSLKKSKGRVIMMSSAAGVACGYPVTSAYSASKRAVEIFSSALRQELRPWGITVSTINPGFHRTEINRNASDNLKLTFEKAPQEVQEQYGEKYLHAASAAMTRYTETNALDPKNVIRAYIHATTSTRPKVQYRVGIDAKGLFPFLQIFPLRVGEVIAYYASTTPEMRVIRGAKWGQGSAPAGVSPAVAATQNV